MRKPALERRVPYVRCFADPKPLAVAVRLTLGLRPPVPGVLYLCEYPADHITAAIAVDAWLNKSRTRMAAPDAPFYCGSVVLAQGKVHDPQPAPLYVQRGDPVDRWLKQPSFHVEP